MAMWSYFEAFLVRCKAGVYNKNALSGKDAIATLIAIHFATLCLCVKILSSCKTIAHLKADSDGKETSMSSKTKREGLDSPLLLHKSYLLSTI
jgi:hypothetical protein